MDAKYKNLPLPVELHAQLKGKAAEQRITIIELVRRWLQQNS